MIPVNFTVLSDYSCLMFFISSFKHFIRIKNLPYRYFNESLVLYSDFSDSRQISLLRISS
nr:MAG TPA: hypothetical protein [Caudoviricetes sp.]